MVLVYITVSETLIITVYRLLGMVIISSLVDPSRKSRTIILNLFFIDICSNLVMQSSAIKHLEHFIKSKQMVSKK